MIYLVAIFQVLQGYILVGSLLAFIWTLFKMQDSGQVIQEAQWASWGRSFEEKALGERGDVPSQLFSVVAVDFVARLGPLDFMLGLLSIFALNTLSLQTAMICCSLALILRVGLFFFSIIRVVDLMLRPSAALVLNLGPFGKPLAVLHFCLLVNFLVMVLIYTLFAFFGSGG